MLSRRFAVLIGAPLLLLSTSLILVSHAASNDCNAKVNFISASKKGALVEVQFQVSTSCPASLGRFTYSYELASRPGKNIERNADGWRGTEGQNFVLKDQISGMEGELPSSVRPISETIESSKL